MLPLPELHVSLRAPRENARNLEPAKGQGIREVERRYLGRHVKADAAALGNRRRELQTHSELFPDDSDGTELSALYDGEGELPSSQEGRLLARKGKQVRLRKTLELSPRLEDVNDPFEIRVGVHKEEPQQSIRDRFDDARIHGGQPLRVDGRQPAGHLFRRTAAHFREPYLQQHLLRGRRLEPIDHCRPRSFGDFDRLPANTGTRHPSGQRHRVPARGHGDIGLREQTLEVPLEPRGVCGHLNGIQPNPPAGIPHQQARRAKLLTGDQELARRHCYRVSDHGVANREPLQRALVPEQR